MALLRQSRPDFGLGVKVKALRPFKLVLSFLERRATFSDAEAQAVPGHGNADSCMKRLSFLKNLVTKFTTRFFILLVTIMLCSHLHCPKAFGLKLFSYQFLTLPHSG